MPELRLEGTPQEGRVVGVWEDGTEWEILGWTRPNAPEIGVGKASEAAAFTRTLTDDSEGEPPDFKTSGDDFGVGEEVVAREERGAVEPPEGAGA